MSSFWGKFNKPFGYARDKPFFVLAPMANVTDWAFRQIIIKTGRPDVFYTEFISCDGIDALGWEKFKGELYFEESERPIVVQFFGAKPDNFYKCAQLAQKLGFDGIDINMGCPDRSIEKQGAGASLIKAPKLAQEIIKEAKRGAGKLPISVKTRLGFNKIITKEWVSYLLETEPAAITMHGRTRKEMSKVPAHWDEIGKVAYAAKDTETLIIGNGDVGDLKDAKQKAKQYNLDGIMVGRGIFTNPWFFNEKVDIKNIKPEQRIDLLCQHLDNFLKLWGNPSINSEQAKSFDSMKKFFKVYISGFEGAKELRTRLMTAKNRFEVLDILADHPA